MTGPIKSLEVSALTAIRGGRMLFRDLRFRIEARHALCIEGANGAGKTSLLRMIAGFLAPAEGIIRLQTNGMEILDGEERGKFAGWLGHYDAVKPQMTVRESLSFFTRLYHSDGKVEEAMEAVGLSRLADLPGQYLSAGQKKRVALARLQLLRRPLWLIDEPLASLDAAGKKVAADLVTAHCSVRRHRHCRDARAARHRLREARAMTALLLRDIRLAARAGGSAMLALAFFAAVATLVPLGVGSDLRLLARIAAGVLWVAAVLASLLALDRLFQADFEDGSLDVIAGHCRHSLWRPSALPRLPRIG